MITTDQASARVAPPAEGHLTDPPDTAEVTISAQQVDLLSVSGRLYDTGLAQLSTQLQELCNTGARYLILDLARVSGCDHRLFDVLGWIHQILTGRRGWMRLVGVGPTVYNALDDATPSESLLVYQTSDWTSEPVG